MGVARADSQSEMLTHFRLPSIFFVATRKSPRALFELPPHIWHHHGGLWCPRGLLLTRAQDRGHGHQLTNAMQAESIAIVLSTKHTQFQISTQEKIYNQAQDQVLQPRREVRIQLRPLLRTVDAMACLPCIARTRDPPNLSILHKQHTHSNIEMGNCPNSMLLP